MKSLIDGLPPEIAAQVHPDWRRNETEYWAKREELLPQYRGQWVAFAGGKVIAASRSSVEIVHSGQASGLHPFITCVGHEAEPFRVRRLTVLYDSAYPGPPLPIVTEFRTQPSLLGARLDRVIPDTGADTSVLPWADCQQVGIDFSIAAPSQMRGVGAIAQPSMLVAAWVYLDGSDYPCHIQVDFLGLDRILGREVLNEMEVLFRGPAREVVINP